MAQQENQIYFCIEEQCILGRSIEASMLETHKLANHNILKESEFLKLIIDDLTEVKTRYCSQVSENIQNSLAQFKLSIITKLDVFISEIQRRVLEELNRICDQYQFDLLRFRDDIDRRANLDEYFSLMKSDWLTLTGCNSEVSSLIRELEAALAGLVDFMQMFSASVIKKERSSKKDFFLKPTIINSFQSSSNVPATIMEQHLPFKRVEEDSSQLNQRMNISDKQRVYNFGEIFREESQDQLGNLCGYSIPKGDYQICGDVINRSDHLLEIKPNGSKEQLHQDVQPIDQEPPSDQKKPSLEFSINDKNNDQRQQLNSVEENRKSNKISTSDIKEYCYKLEGQQFVQQTNLNVNAPKKKPIKTNARIDLALSDQVESLDEFTYACQGEKSCRLIFQSDNGSVRARKFNCKVRILNKDFKFNVGFINLNDYNFDTQKGLYLIDEKGRVFRNGQMIETSSQLVIQNDSRVRAKVSKSNNLVISLQQKGMSVNLCQIVEHIGTLPKCLGEYTRLQFIVVMKNASIQIF